MCAMMILMRWRTVMPVTFKVRLSETGPAESQSASPGIASVGRDSETAPYGRSRSLTPDAPGLGLVLSSEGLSSRAFLLNAILSRCLTAGPSAGGRVAGPLNRRIKRSAKVF